jgi:multicomponent Na+:H+ antiporter subunit E
MGFRDVNPSVIRFRPELNSEFGEVTLANSITLTPGTVTMEIEDGAFIVHAVSPEAAEAVLEGSMTRKVQQVEGGA